MDKHYDELMTNFDQKNANFHLVSLNFGFAAYLVH